MSMYQPRPPAGTGGGRGLGTPTALLGCLSALLVFVLLTGAIVSWIVIDRRGSTTTQLEDQVAALTAANIDFQANIDQLAAERDDLARRVEELTTGFDEIRGERDDLAAERSRIELRLGETEGLLADRDRQLAELRQEGIRQVERADDLESLGAILVEIIVIDNEIHDEFINLVDLIFLAFEFTDEGDDVSADIAWELALESIERLDQLLTTRDEILDLIE